MIEREKDLMENPAEKQSFTDPNEPKATTAFPTIIVVVTILAIVLLSVIYMLYR